ncbi:hypothetical protein RhiirA4_404499 [Rhizophagus irregularis]|uniref:Serine-threonine/tyrosine-protein kinase catalytic domain-containing protein n=1 Tax=Rhizophagus irregularis TaxID=588596 RepID=A0A2I1GPD5_9GLOM|nr:hypothetical protein RhiirA4_404499 [Rhizophagus irregularis]
MQEISMQEISEGFGSNIPLCYLELVQKCIDYDPEKRPDPLDLLEELHKSTNKSTPTTNKSII